MARPGCSHCQMLLLRSTSVFLHVLLCSTFLSKFFTVCRCLFLCRRCVSLQAFTILFLIIYSLFLMTELREVMYSTDITLLTNCTTCCLQSVSVGCFEIVTYIFVFTIAIEEIRQVCSRKVSSHPGHCFWSKLKNSVSIPQMLFRDQRSMRYVRQKLKDWWSDFWNKFDTASILTFILAVILRFTLKGDSFEATRWLFSFSLVVYFVRFSQLFFVLEELGPKIIMIRKMVRLYICLWAGIHVCGPVPISMGWDPCLWTSNHVHGWYPCL